MELKLFRGYLFMEEMINKCIRQMALQQIAMLKMLLAQRKYLRLQNRRVCKRRRRQTRGIWSYLEDWK